jgi:hypothetical protein
LPEGKKPVKGWQICMSTSNKGNHCFITIFKTGERHASCIQYFIFDAMGNNLIFLEQKQHLNNFLTLA